MNPQADQVFGNQRAQSDLSRSKRKSSARGYALGVCLLACFLFLALWWLLHIEGGEPNNGALTAAMSAVIVILIGFVARDHILLRHLGKRRTREHYDAGFGPTIRAQKSGRRPLDGSVSQKMAVLNALERKLADLNAKATTPEQHLNAYRICEEYLTGLHESLGGIALAPHARHGLHARQERVRAIQRQHLLLWARESSQKLIYKAQRRARASSKIETALKASEIIESALRVYPEERQLHESIHAIRDYIASARVEYWMELAERAAFKGNYRKSIDRYQNALFYLDRDKAWSKSRAEIEDKIQRQVQSIHTILSLSEEADDLLPPEAPPPE